MNTQPLITLGVVAALGLWTSVAEAQTAIADQPRWALIGDPGNPETTEMDGNALQFAPVGSVDYLYRISILELTVGEHLEFIEAYRDIYFKNNPELEQAAIDFAGHYFIVTRSQIQYFVNDRRAANMGWMFAARYLNWLHHGKVNEEWAFESGVFDTTTFEPDDNGDFDWQANHSPEARYWFPTTDEWSKAAYWDPNKLGEGVGGYWRYPNSTMNALRPLFLPKEGGQRNASRDFAVFPLDVGSFSEERSPWGLLDLAGGEQEWLDRLPLGNGDSRITGGSWFFDLSYNEPYSPYVIDHDHITVFGSTPGFFPAGVRLASTAYHPADLNQDGRVNYFDISVFIQLFAAGDERADFRLDGVFDLDDVRVFLGLFAME